MRTSLLLLFTLLLFLKLSGQKTSDIELIPMPASVILKEGNFILSEKTKVILPKKFKDKLGSYIVAKFKNDIGITIGIHSGKFSGTNYIAFKKVSDPKIADEGYTLEVTSKQILIKAKSYAGLFYGFQTLRQLAPIGKTASAAIPAVEINDNPRFEWRGLMLDVSRHFRSKEFVLKQIDIIAGYKLNKFHWHLTDDQGWRIEIKKYPELTNKGAWRADRSDIPWWNRELATAEEPKTVGGYYTQEDIKEVIAYAKERNIEVIPEIDIPGHSKALVASYPFLSCLDDRTFEVAVGGKAPNNALCAGEETTYTFLADIIKEVAHLFPSKYLHIGGDECNKTNWKSCPDCTIVMEENGFKDYEELQSHFIQRVNKLVTAEKKTMIGWDEILSGNGAKGATIMAWRRGKHTSEITAPKSGYPTIMTSYKAMYISQLQGPTLMEPQGPKVVLPLSKVYIHEPVPETLTTKEAKLVLGNQVSLWGEFTPTDAHTEYMLYPRTLAAAEVSWSNPSTKNWERFHTTLGTHFKRLERDDINFSNSIYTVYASYAINELEAIANVFLDSELNGYDIRYSLDGEEPTVKSKKYNGTFKTAAKTLLKTGLFNAEGKLMGKITELRLR